MKIDVLSISLTSIISSLGFFIAMMLIWHLSLRRREFFFWGLMQLLYPAGLLLLNCRDRIPDFFSIIVGNVFLLATYSCLWIGLDIFWQRKPSYGTIASMTGAYVAAACYYTYVTPSISMRILAFSLTAMAFNVVIARTQITARKKSGFSIEIVAASAMIFDAMVKFFTAGAQFFTMSNPQPFPTNYFIGVNILLTNLTNVVWNTSAFIMVFNEVLGVARSAEKKAVESRNLFEGIINAIPIRVFWKDASLKYLGANVNFVKDAGLSDVNELIGRNDSELVWKDKATAYNADDRGIILTGRSRINYEEMIDTADGGTHYILTSKVPLADSEGRVTGVVGAYQDITPQKNAQKKIRRLLTEKETLLREVNHRIKNNMSMVSSMLFIQATQLGDSTSAGAALLEARNRLQGMSIIYDKLYGSSDYKNLSVREYLDALIDEISAAYSGAGNITFIRKIEDFELDSNLLFPAGIIINEVMTNSCKYAFNGHTASRAANIVEVGVKKTPDGRVELDIGDNGPGFVVPEPSKARKSFGIRLIELLSKQLGASVTVETATGTRYHISFPIAADAYR